MVLMVLLMLLMLVLVGHSVRAELAVLLLLLPCPASSAGRMPWRIRTIVARPWSAGSPGLIGGAAGVLARSCSGNGSRHIMVRRAANSS